MNNKSIIYEHRLVKHRVLIVLMTLFLLGQVNAQSIPLVDDSISQIVKYEIKLPAIEILIDSAFKNSPKIRMKKLQLEERGIVISQSRKTWLKSLSLNGSYNYGNNVRNVDGSIGTIYSSEAVNSYGTGFSISLNLYDLYNYNQKVKKSNIEYSKGVQELLEQEFLLRQEVINLYHQISLNAKILNIRIDYFNTTKVNKSYAEINFKNNKLSIDEYSKITELFIKAKIGFQSAKTTYLLSLISLEEKTGIKIR